MTPLRTERIPWREIEGRTVIVQPRAGKVHELNPVGSFLWLRADGTRNLEEITAELCERFDVEAREARADALEFYSSLQAQDLVRVIDPA